MREQEPAPGVASRFDAETVVRTATVTERGRFEIELKDAQGRIQVVSLPLSAAVDLGFLICEISENAPYLIGGFRGRITNRRQR